MKSGDGGATLSEADVILDFGNGDDVGDTDLVIGGDGSGNATISVSGEILAILTGVAPGDLDRGPVR